MVNDNKGQFWNGAKNHNLETYDNTIIENQKKEIKPSRPIYKPKKAFALDEDEDE